MNKLLQITEKEEFYKLINENEKVLITFVASWCSTCKMQKEIIFELAEQLKNKLLIVKADIDLLEEIANDYKIKVIPTTCLFINEEIKEKITGLVSKGKILEKIINYI
ncbi:MAG: thioredoxin family protein [Clostridia bacterium]|nr:thioredoxin family protein [Clostridia bacterium]